MIKFVFLIDVENHQMLSEYICTKDCENAFLPQSGLRYRNADNHKNILILFNNNYESLYLGILFCHYWIVQAVLL